MKRSKKRFLIGLLVLLIIVLGVAVFIVFNDKSKLSVNERNWLNSNRSNVLNINVKNNSNVFAKNGSGVFYDYLNDFGEEYSLNINPISFNDEAVSGITLGTKTKLKNNDTLFYKDHFVLISKTKDIFTSANALNNKKVGVLNGYSDYVKSYITSYNINFVDIYNISDKAEVDYIIVPLIESISDILKYDYNINYHFSDINIYYTLSTDDTVLSNIMIKYFNKWQKELENYFYKELFKEYVADLNLTEQDIADLRSVEYNFGFVKTAPYSITSNGKFGGIISSLLNDFSKFALVDFNYVSYNNYTKFINAVKNREVDLYFNYYDVDNNYNLTNGYKINYVVITRNDNLNIVNSLDSLKNTEVYVEDGTKLHEYLKNRKDIKIKTYSNKELRKLNKKDVTIIIDKDVYNYYKNKDLSNYVIKYEEYTTNNYAFKVKKSTVFYELLDRYMEFKDYNVIRIKGVNNYYETTKIGDLLFGSLKYAITLLIFIIVLLIVLHKKGKKVVIAKKIRKEDKIKFIDQLTSLKNRNYLNENIEKWNNNTIYPQTILVVDLNKIQEINDAYGYEQGDKQITSCANILIKTQLDNSEIMRTDGNEFVVYLVGYNQKQITNYIHKLNKEIKKMPYEYGAEYGYSMIDDDIKTVEDALNEAIEDMKKQKENNEK